jgi:hypothetical protein
MLEIRRGSTAVRSYENTFFREFSKNLSAMFDRYSIDGVLIGNSECESTEKLKIDSLLITNNAVLLIDVKNYSGDIILPSADADFSNGIWKTGNGITIKGGSYVNPFKQLFEQKRMFSWVYGKGSTIESDIGSNGDKFNPSHVKRLVCFQNPVNIIGELPKSEINFFIVDPGNYLEVIKDILDIDDDEVKLTSKSFDVFKEVYKANPFFITERYEKPIEIIEKTLTDLDYDALYPDQISALEDIQEFIKSNDEKVFILQGTSLSGKSHLIPFIKEIGFNNHFEQVECFALSTRVASNLLSESEVEFNSLYSYIYGGGSKNLLDDENEISESNVDIEIIPLKKSDDADKAIFIVDEAQLISDVYHQSIDLRFGSGKILKDLLEFVNLENTNRKIVFIGDAFQITMGGKEEVPLYSSYLKDKYGLDVRSFQLTDKPDKSLVVKKVLHLVDHIRCQVFNKFLLGSTESVKVVEKSEVSSFVSNGLNSNPQFHILCFSNSGALKVNLWIKSAFIKNGSDLSKKDLVIINNNFQVKSKNDPFSGAIKIFNGQFGTINHVGDSVVEVVSLKGNKTVSISVREVDIEFSNIGDSIKVLSLENYRLSEKGEISNDEIVAIKIILNKEISLKLEENKFEYSDKYRALIQSEEYVKTSKDIEKLEIRLGRGDRVKTEKDKKERELRKLIKLASKEHKMEIKKTLYSDTSSKYFKFKNLAYLKFGWALTVHKAMSYKWDTVLFDINQGENRGMSNENYFKWVYTGITRAKNSIGIINYKAFNSLSKIEFKEGNSNNIIDKSAYYIANENVEKELGQLIREKIQKLGKYSISTTHQNYLEIYEFKNLVDQVAKVSFYYNKKGRIKNPILINSSSDEFGAIILNALNSKNKIDNLDFISDSWRRDLFKEISTPLEKDGLQIISIIQEKFKDTIQIECGESSLNVDMYYNGDGFYTSILPTFYNDVKIWDNYKNILILLKK